MDDFRERLAMQWERLNVLGYVPLGELTLIDLASVAALPTEDGQWRLIPVLGEAY